MHKLLIILFVLGNTVADGENGILRNATIAVQLKYLNNFWRSLEMVLINCKVGLNLNGQQCIVFCLQLVLIMVMLILIILFLLSKTQNYMSLKELY